MHTDKSTVRVGSRAVAAHKMGIFVIVALLAGGLGCLSLIGASAQSRYEGQWTIENRRDRTALHLTLIYGDGTQGRNTNTTGFDIAPEHLQGLSQAQIMSAGSQVRFQIVRDAGVLNCEGWFKDGRGSGHFTFAANPSFVSELKRRGYDEPTERQMFHMATSGMTLAFLDELKAQGYAQATLEQIVRMGTHGVTIEYVRDLKSLGYNLQSVDQVTRMVDHGVSIEFIRELIALGYKDVSAEMLVRTVDHGVTPEFI
ncbi:MAG TPA: hypothetical protein VNI02_01295, partial [Blastocatellia bacterium]|nr:hypothetical protein [Blastocatellia bacterium]